MSGDRDIDIARELGSHHARLEEIDKKLAVLFKMIDILREWKWRQTGIQIVLAFAVSFLANYGLKVIT